MKKTIAAALLLTLITACSTPEKIAQKAITNTEAFAKVGRKFLELNPCANDSTFSIYSDTLVYIDTTYDVDSSLYFPSKDCCTSDRTLMINPIGSFNCDSILVVNGSSIKFTPPIKTRTITKRTIYRDTFKIVVVDKLLLKLSQDSTNKYKQLYEAAQARSLVEIDKTKHYKKELTVTWLVLGIISIIILFIIAYKSKINAKLETFKNSINKL